MHKRNNNNKVIIILCLLAVVVSLSIGFSVFSNNLIIKQGATVTPSSSDFKVLFSSSKDSLQAGTITPASKSGAGITATNANINNSNPSSPSLTGLNATFKVPNSRVQYTFYVRNDGSYDAYLKSIKFGKATGVDVFKKCTAKNGATQKLVDEACKNINASIDFGENKDSSSLWGITFEKMDSGSEVKSVTGHKLEKGQSEKVSIWIYYGLDNPNAPVADGDFNVEFGDITLTYSSVD